MEGAVFVQTNAAHNEVIAYARDAAGMLTHRGHVRDGRSRQRRGTPALAGLGHADAGPASPAGDQRGQQRRERALAVNGGMLDADQDGAGRRRHRGASRSTTVSSSVLSHRRRIDPDGFRLIDGDLVPVEGASNRTLSTPDGAQVGLHARRSRAHRDRARRRQALRLRRRHGRDARRARARSTRSGATPYGFAISPDGTLVVTEAFRAEKGAAAASSYRVDGDTITPGTASIGNGRSEICWAVISNDGRYAFTTNFADGAVSRYAIGMDGSAHPRGRHRRHRPQDGQPRSSGRGPVRRRPASSTRSTPIRVRSSAWSVDDRRAACRWLGSWGGVPTTVAGLAARLMRLEPFYRVTFTTPGVAGASPAEGGSGTEGQSFLIAEGRAEGRLSARYRAANFPRRRVDGALEPEFRGALETDDGATVLFHWEGLATLTDSGMRQLLGMVAAHRATTSGTAGSTIECSPSRARSGRVRPALGSTWSSKSARWCGRRLGLTSRIWLTWSVPPRATYGCEDSTAVTPSTSSASMIE